MTVLPNGKRQWTEVDMPPSIDLTNKHHRTRSAIKEAVKTDVTAGKRVEELGGKDMSVIDVGQKFHFKVDIEEVKTTKIKVSEG